MPKSVKSPGPSVSKKATSKTSPAKGKGSKKSATKKKPISKSDFDTQISELRPENIPKHVAIILDGNGRWAKKRNLSRSEGHRAGGETLDRLLDFFVKLNVPVVSLYAFSTENWKRPKAEIKAIWKLLNEFFKTRSDRAMELGIRIRASGDLEPLPKQSQQLINKVVKQTANNDRLIANFCVNYGSRDEICKAATSILKHRIHQYITTQSDEALQDITENEIDENLYTQGLPDVDLLLRPGGEHRISNFLLWQCAYAEIYVTDTLWPDFSADDMLLAIKWYQGRQRRFGGL